MDKKKLTLDKEVIETLSSDDLSQVQGGNDANQISHATFCCEQEKGQKQQSTSIHGWCCD